MACRRGRCVRWQAKSPYSPDDHGKVSRRQGAHCPRRQRCFAEIGVEVLLDWSNSESNSCRLGLHAYDGDRALPPPCWLIAESSDAYAFTVRRPGDVGLAADDVEVQMERIPGSTCSGERSFDGSYARPDSRQGPGGIGNGVFSLDRESVQKTVSSLLTIFCERLVRTTAGLAGAGIRERSNWESMLPADSWQELRASHSAEDTGGSNQDDTDIMDSGSEAYDSTSSSETDCDCNLCSRTASGLPWKFGRRFSLPVDAVAERAVAAHTNGALTVLVPRSRILRPTWFPSPAIPSFNEFSSCFAAQLQREQSRCQGESCEERPCSREDRWLLQVTQIPQQSQPESSHANQQGSEGLPRRHGHSPPGWYSSPAPQCSSWDTYSDFGTPFCAGANPHSLHIADEDAMDMSV